MSVTMYVTSANYICYESQNNDVFEEKSWLSNQSSNYT